MNPAHELLLSCLRNDPPGIKIRLLKDLRDDDWDALFQASNNSRTSPILYHTIGPFLSDIQAPVSIRQKLREAYHCSAARNMRLYRQIVTLFSVFNNENIPVILLKGAHLAELVYTNNALRQMGDVDILVRKPDLSRVSELMAGQGYRPARQDQDRPLDVCHLPPFTKTDSIPVEIHFNIVDQPFSQKFDVKDLWERSRKELIQGVDVLTLSPEDLFLHLCIHASVRHGFDNGIEPLVDTCCVLERYQEEIDWDELLTRARQWGATRCVYVMLALSEKLLGAPVPEQVILKLEPANDDFDAISSAKGLMFEKSAPTASNVARLFGTGSWLDKLKLFMRRAFPPHETMPVVDGWGESNFSRLMMYFVRIRGVWKRHRKTVWRAMRNDVETSTIVGIENRRNRLKDWLERQ